MAPVENHELSFKILVMNFGSGETMAKTKFKIASLGNARNQRFLIAVSLIISY